MLRLLVKRFGILSEDLVAQVKSLSLEQVEDLADALLDFRQVSDLLAWLQAKEEL